MYEEKKLRKADFIMSVLLFLFGAWIIRMATKMPMKATYAGVKNIWYVSPALFPLIIGGALIILSIVLLNHTIKVGGARSFIREISGGIKFTEKSMRFWVMILLFFSFIYLYIPHIDFYLSTMFFLLVFITIFYFDDKKLMQKLSVYYLIVTLVFIIIFTAKLDNRINQMFKYFTDFLMLIFILIYLFYSRVLIGKNKEMKEKYRLSVMVSIFAPLVLCPVFKYLLLVPLPKEGGIIQLFNYVRYILL